MRNNLLSEIWEMQNIRSIYYWDLQYHQLNKHGDWRLSDLLVKRGVYSCSYHHFPACLRVLLAIYSASFLIQCSEIKTRVDIDGPYMFVHIFSVFLLRYCRNWCHFENIRRGKHFVLSS